MLALPTYARRACGFLPPQALSHPLAQRFARRAYVSSRQPTVVSIVGDAPPEQPFPADFFIAPPRVAAGGSALYVVTAEGQGFSYGRGPWGELAQGVGLRSLPSPTKLLLTAPAPAGASSKRGSASVADDGEPLSLAAIYAGVSHAFFLGRCRTVLLGAGSAQDSQLGLDGAFGPQGSYHGGSQPLAVFDPVPLPLPAEVTSAASPGSDTKGGVHVAALAASKYFSLMLLSSGNVYAAGSGFAGELGLGQGVTVVTGWSRLEGLPEGRVAAVGAGKTFAAAVTSDKRLFVWGTLGTTGIQSSTAASRAAIAPGAGAAHFASQTPIEVALPGAEGQGADNEKDAPLTLACGYHHLIVSDGRRAWTFGLGSNGALGRGTTEHALGSAAVPLQLPEGLVAPCRVAAGPYASAVLGADGALYVSGRVDVAPASLGSAFEAAVASAASQRAGEGAPPLAALLRGPDGLRVGEWAGTRTLTRAEPLPGRPVVDIAMGAGTLLAALA